MAMGVPVICSPAAAGGVDAVPGEHLLTADSCEAWVNNVLAILGNDAERQRLAAAGRARVLSHHSWGASMLRLDRLIEQTVFLKPNKS
jgi:glycosyltransferase involved in cell wall biosynthesis